MVGNRGVMFQRASRYLLRQTTTATTRTTLRPSQYCNHVKLSCCHPVAAWSDASLLMKRQFVTVDVTSAGSISKSSSGRKGNERGGLDHQQMEEHIVKLNGQIRMQYRHADYEGALETSKVVLEECQRYFPSDEHPAIASAHVNIGLMHKHLGHYDEARTHYTQALHTYAHLVGTDHASYAATLHNMGTLDRAQALFLDNQNDNPDADKSHDADADTHRQQRMKLNQSAIHHFEQALKIRTLELGQHHAYTITTRSSLGAALASQVLAEFITANNTASSTPTTTLNTMNLERWQVAQDHLEQALTSAIQNPRGPQIQPSPSDAMATTTKRRDRSKSKKERRQLSKQHKKQKHESLTTQKPSNVTTLAAAGAAQNLAIFYKSRADHMEPQNYDLYSQAVELYKAALNVRTQLLPAPETHPSVLETKFSLAECYDAMGNQTKAQSLREQILNAYPIEEKVDHNDDHDDHEGKEGQNQPPTPTSS